MESCEPNPGYSEFDIHDMYEPEYCDLCGELTPCYCRPALTCEPTIEDSDVKF
jgi:hypothetical protein